MRWVPSLAIDCALVTGARLSLATWIGRGAAIVHSRPQISFLVLVVKGSKLAPTRAHPAASSTGRPQLYGLNEGELLVSDAGMVPARVPNAITS